VSETPLAGGDVNVGANVVVRVGDTVRRPAGPHTAAVHALLRHLEQAGFDGAPRALGRDEAGREILSFVEGDAALGAVPGGDEVLHGLGRLLRRMHDAQAGFAPPPEARWHDGPLALPPGPVVCHNDVFPPNVILRDGRPAALIDWDFACPGSPLYDVASAANFWVPLAPGDRARGLPASRPGERLRILCDGYGLARGDRLALPEVVAHRNRMGYEIHRVYGGARRLPGWRAMWDAGSGDVILARAAWFEAHRAQLLRYLA
jgi:Phosphotransferase enzyme family